MMTADGILNALELYISDFQKAAEECRESVKKYGENTPLEAFCKGQYTAYKADADALRNLINDARAEEDGYYERMEMPVEE